MIKIKLLNENAAIPTYANKTDAGMDLYASEDIKISSRALVSTGIAIKIPEGYYGRVAPRSGLSCKGIDIGAGVIDSDYRGEIKVLVINNTEMNLFIIKGDKFAQLIITKILENPILDVVDVLDETSRGDGGFGSTGN